MHQRHWEKLAQEQHTEIEHLTADRDNSNALLDDCRHERNVLQKICAERANEIEKLRQALEPFARVARNVDAQRRFFSDDFQILHKLGDMRTARRLLEP